MSVLWKVVALVWEATLETREHRMVGGGHIWAPEVSNCGLFRARHGARMGHKTIWNSERKTEDNIKRDVRYVCGEDEGWVEAAGARFCRRVGCPHWELSLSVRVCSQISEQKALSCCTWFLLDYVTTERQGVDIFRRSWVRIWSGNLIP